MVPSSRSARRVALNGVTINVGRALRTCPRRAIVAAWGPGAVFLLNAPSFHRVLVVVYRMATQDVESILPAERCGRYPSWVPLRQIRARSSSLS